MKALLEAMNKLNEIEEKLNIFDIIDVDYVLSGLSNHKTAYLTGDINDIIKSLKNNGCEISNYTNHNSFQYCDVIYNGYHLKLDSYSDKQDEDISCILTGTYFYYGGTTEYSKYNVSFTIEGQIESQDYLEEEILDYLHRLESNTEYSKRKINNFKIIKEK